MLGEGKEKDRGATLHGCAVVRLRGGPGGKAADPPTEQKKEITEQKHNGVIRCAVARLCGCAFAQLCGEPGRGRRPPQPNKKGANRAKTLWTPL
jgi:hypothetical protein